MKMAGAVRFTPSTLLTESGQEGKGLGAGEEEQADNSADAGQQAGEDGRGEGISQDCGG